MVRDSQPEEDAPLQVEDDQIVVGTWSADLMELATVSGDLRSMIRAGKSEEAQALVQSRSVEEQAALVALDENPEEILSLTGMDEQGRPGYKPAVVDKLPTELLTGLIASRDLKFSRYNAEVLKVMSPKVFVRALNDTLEPVHQADLRVSITWDWLQAVAAVGDPIKRAELLVEADWDVIEDAIVHGLEKIDPGRAVPGAAAGGFGVSRLQAMSEGFTGLKPSEIVGDNEIGRMLNVLGDAAPEIVGELMMRAARRVEWM